MDLRQSQTVSVLYDLAMAMAGETRPRPLALKMLERFLIHTECACGAVVLNGDEVYAAVGNRALRRLEGQAAPWSAAASYGGVLEAEGGLFPGAGYGYALSLPLPELGYVILFSPQEAVVAVASRRAAALLQPVLAKLARSLTLCLESERQAAELLEAKVAAESASRAKTAFLANMSHEIRTPMNAIIGLTHLLREDSTDPRARTRLTKVADAAQHLLQLLNDILDLSKVEAGRLVLEDETFSPTRMIDHAISLLGERAEAKGLSLRWSVDPALPQVLHGDVLRLGQVLLNFIGNAIKFSEQGTIAVRAIQERRVDDEVVLRLEVQDQGIGLSREQREGIFQPFVQADSSTTRHYGGTGLGLVIVRRLAGLMNGDTGVESELGVGSTFWFSARLRVGSRRSSSKRIRASLPAERPEQTLRTQCRGARVLLAEDNPVNQEVARELLERVGLEVDVVADGRAAVECARATRYAIVLMDVHMPVLDGLDASRAIRDLPGCEEIPIVAMTANAFADDRQRCLDAGMNGHIGKPVAPAALYRELLTWFPAITVPTVPPAVARTLSEIPGLDVETGLASVAGNGASYLRLLRMFVRGHAGDGAAMRQALAEGRRGDAERMAHTLKGVAATLGALELHATALTVESAIRAADDSAPGLEELERSLSLLVSDLSRLVEEQPQKAPELSAVERAKSTEVLRRLEVLLTTDDTRANQIWAESAQLLSTTLGPAASKLGAEIDRFEFDKALVTLHTLTKAS